jgi:hypothetical protein
MKQLVSIFFFACLQLSVFASGPTPRKIQVVDAMSGEELSAVCVKIDGYNEFLYTDAQGFLEFPAMNSTDTEVHFSVVSYKPTTMKTFEIIAQSSDGVVKLSPR